MAKVTIIPSTIDPRTHLPTLQTKKRRVAAYARVSTDSDEQFTSYEAQIDYYTKFIKENPQWEFVEVYTDEGITGTSTKRREGFKRMIQDAMDGKIDLIVTKSVSRFARNTVDSLVTIRQLKEKGVEVFFQKENIYTLDSKGELLVTIMSSIAQEEARSISENVTWGQRKAFSDGKVHMGYKNFLGYEKGPDGKPKVVEEEAKIIRLIYKMFLEGATFQEICFKLEELGAKSPAGKAKWGASTVLSILTNEKYKGDALLQKKFTVDFLQHKMKVNEGEVPQYYVENSHEAIIDSFEWDSVQIELERRRKMGRNYSGKSEFANKLICADCGGYYGKKVWHSNTPQRKEIWQCNQKFKKGKPKCQTVTLTIEEIRTAFVEAFNKLSQYKNNTIADIEMMISILSDRSEILDQIERQSLEVEMITDQVKKIVDENATTVQDQQEYLIRYEKLKERFDEEIVKLNNLRKENEYRIKQEKMMRVYLDKFKRAPDYLEEWNSSLFHYMVEKAFIYKDNSIEFVFYSGAKIKVDVK